MSYSKFHPVSSFDDGDHRNGFPLPHSCGVNELSSSPDVRTSSESACCRCIGTVAISMAAVQDFQSLLLCRFLLGALQCGFFPAFIYYTSLWYRRKEQALRLGFIWSSSALAGAFGGLLAYAVGHFESTLFAQWQLIFIVRYVGLLTAVRDSFLRHRFKDYPRSSWRFSAGSICPTHRSKHGS